MGRGVLIAILAKDKAHCLPHYLACIEAQTWPKARTHLYVRTNNNTDRTAEILREWLNGPGRAYASVTADFSDVEEPVQNYAPHEWNSARFRVLAAIRQASVDCALAKGCHYFVADCDNFLAPHTLEALARTRLPVVGPFLRTRVREGGHAFYSNYHFHVDANGYFRDSPEYYRVLERAYAGLIQVGVIHCTYFVRHEVLPLVRYADGGPRHEYVVFSDALRRAGVPQYLDNREQYGWLTFADDEASFLREKDEWGQQ